MDASLPSSLKTANEVEREQFLNNLLLHEAAPLIRKVLRQRLGLYVNHLGANPQQPDAENLYQDILTKLLQRSQEWLADAEKNAIHNYHNLVITTATNACHDYLRAKSPNRARFKNKLREICIGCLQNDRQRLRIGFCCHVGHIYRTLPPFACCTKESALRPDRGYSF